MEMRGRHTRSSRTDTALSNHRTTRQRVLVVVGILTLLTACSDDDGTTRASHAKPAGSAASATQLGARAALSGFDCQADADGNWSAKGTLNNGDSSKASYVVRISVAEKNSHVVASTTKEVAVEAAGKADFTAAKFGEATGETLKCSVHVTRAVG
jgi:hypothetical protein